MYQSQDPGLGLSFKLPASVTNFVRGIVGAVVRGTSVTVPTPAGPITYNVGDPAQVAQLRQLITGARLNVATPQPGPTPGPSITQALADNATPLLIGGAVLLGVLLLSRRR